MRFSDDVPGAHEERSADFEREESSLRALVQVAANIRNMLQASLEDAVLKLKKSGQCWAKVPGQAWTDRVTQARTEATRELKNSCNEAGKDAYLILPIKNPTDLSTLAVAAASDCHFLFNFVFCSCFPAACSSCKPTLPTDRPPSKRPKSPVPDIGFC